MHLCFATSTNRRFKRDGSYFVSEMTQYEKHHGVGNCITHRIPTKGRKASQLRHEVIEKTKQALKKYPNGEINKFAFFMHGSPKSLLGAGLNIWTVNKWVNCLPKDMPVEIALYSCKNGKAIKKAYGGEFARTGVMRGEYGFAMRLGYFLAQRGIAFKIYAHTTSGDTTRNPYVQRLSYLDGDWRIGRGWLIEPVSRWQGRRDPEGRALWLHWVGRLRHHPDFRFRAPYMTSQEIRQEIADAGNLEFDRSIVDDM